MLKFLKSLFSKKDEVSDEEYLRRKAEIWKDINSGTDTTTYNLIKNAERLNITPSQYNKLEGLYKMSKGENSSEARTASDMFYRECGRLGLNNYTVSNTLHEILNKVKLSTSTNTTNTTTQ